MNGNQKKLAAWFIASVELICGTLIKVLPDGHAVKVFHAIAEVVMPALAIVVATFPISIKAPDGSTQLQLPESAADTAASQK